MLITQLNVNRGLQRCTLPDAFVFCMHTFSFSSLAYLLSQTTKEVTRDWNSADER